MTVASPDPDAPLVVRFPALGDAVLLTVLLEALWRRWRRPVHVLGSGPWTAELLAHDPAVGRVHLVSSRRAPHWLTPSRWSADRWLRAHRGPVYLCDPDVHAQRIIDRAEVPAARLVRAWDHWPGNHVHWADWWLQVAALDAPGIPGPTPAAGVPARPRLHVPASWHAEAAAWLTAHGLGSRPLVLLQPGHKKTHKRGRVATAGHDKHWPASHWAHVMRGVAAGLPGAALLVCGSPREAALVQEIIDAAGPLPGDTLALNVAARAPTVMRLAALAARAHSMISVDTGPAHVAGAMDCPLVVLYASAGWGRWKPRAPSADVFALGPEAPTPTARLLDIDPDATLAAWSRLRPRGTLSVHEP